MKYALHVVSFLCCLNAFTSETNLLKESKAIIQRVTLEEPRYSLQYYKNYVDQVIAKSISILGPKSILRDACEYSLMTGGKRLRPSIVLMVADALGGSVDATEAALSVEFLHTASLIADDLPCMDNDDERRGKPTLHKVYGETISILATYALISVAFESLENMLSSIETSEVYSKDKTYSIGRCAMKIATKCAGVSGVTGGQFLDIFPPKLTEESIRDVIYKKTVTLFEAAFAFGWVFGGGDIDLLETVKKAAYHFGMAFQIVDDLGDTQQDITNNRDVNMANLIGKDAAYFLVKEEIALFEESLEKLNIYTPAFKNMIKLLHQKAAQNLSR